jgi:di/tricarboxylate transporter
MELGFKFYYSLGILIILSIVLIKEFIRTDLAVFSALIFLLLGRVVSVKEAFAGFSNIGVITIGLLFVVAGGLKSAGLLNAISKIVMGKNSSNLRTKLFRLTLPVTFTSAFMNNTPIVAILLPAVKSWANRNNLSPSKFLIPLSYSAILGGMLTLIGSSTNLIVHGLLLENGFKGFSFFEITPIGLTVALVGIVYIVLFAPKMLPERIKVSDNLNTNVREFVIELKVTNEFEGVGKSIEAAGLRHLRGLFLFQIEREGETITAVSSHEKIRVGDRLFFTGLPGTIVELQKRPGLQLVKNIDFDLKNYDSDKVKVYEAVISNTSPLVGKTVRNSQFRTIYGGVILAIHRNGERIEKKIGDILLKPGDTLLVLAEESFYNKWYNSKDFYLIANSSPVDSKPVRYAVIAVLTLIAMVIAIVFNLLELPVAVGLAAIIMVGSGVVSPKKAHEFVDFKVLIIIASSFGIAQAISNSGLAKLLADWLISTKSIIGTVGLLAGVFYLTSFFNLIISSNATAAFIFPFAIGVAVESGFPVHPFALILIIASAASFASPLSYQTNLMVYGAGGYRFRDYLKFGLPLQLFIGIIAIGVVYCIYF